MNRRTPKVLLFGHGGSANRGCEAIVRGTINILCQAFGREVQIVLASLHVSEDVDAHIPHIFDYVTHDPEIRRWTSTWARLQFYKRIMRDHVRAYLLAGYPTIDYIGKVDMCLSIGGDNYCYDTPYWLYVVDRCVKAANKKLVLWGASIEPDFIDAQMERDLRLFDLITVRESITYGALQNKGLANVHLHPDPAFILEKEDLPLPAKWQNGNTIGINVSPLVVNYEKQSGLTLRSVRALMKHILETTDANIALIPHVTWPYSDDRRPLKSLFDSFQDSHRIVWIGGSYNAPQLKGFISRCRLFIGARTHSTIAAYSTCVPTLALGYSVKARGIARDIFGTESLVLPVQSLSSEKELINAFDTLYERENELRNHLQKVMPSYIEAAWRPGELVRELVE